MHTIVQGGHSDGCDATNDHGNLDGKDDCEQWKVVRRGYSVIGRREVLGEATKIAARILDVGIDASKGYHQRLKKDKRHRTDIIGKKAYEVPRVVVGGNGGIEKFGGGQAVGVGDKGLAVVKEAVFDHAAIGLVANVVFKARGIWRKKGRQVRRIACGIYLRTVRIDRLDADGTIGIRKTHDRTGEGRVMGSDIPGKGKKFGTQVDDHLTGSEMRKIHKKEEERQQ